MSPPVRTDRRRGTWVAVVALAIAVSLVVGLTGRYDLHRVGSASMAPTIGTGDLIVVDTQAYDRSRPRHGELIVFADPGGWAGSDPTLDGTVGELFVKRVIGVGGDEVYCCDADQRLLVNGEIVDEHYLPADAAGQGLRSIAHVPDGRMWVLGDDRMRSIDSRHRLGTPSLGYVAETDVVGRVVGTVPLPSG
jgi:signal peptidase I